MAELFRYAAFISYSSKDARFAQRLHRALEAYGIPATLGKFDMIGGGKRNRIYPVFRDREELPAGDLGERIEAALRASAALVVVCSPAAAASPWVQKEIAFFFGLGRRDRVFAIITDDAPLRDDDGRDATPSCFPAAFKGNGSGATLEPIAGDARRSKDGFRNAWLKIIAGLIGVAPGQLVDRDRRRRRSQRLAASAGVSAAWVDAQTWRTRMSTYAEAVTNQGRPLDALPFAAAGMPAPGSLILVRSDRAEGVLVRVSGPISSYLGKMKGYLLSADGTVLVVHNEGGGGFFYNFERSAQPRDLALHSGDELIALSANGAALIVKSVGGAAIHYDLARGGAKRDLGGWVEVAAVSDNGAALAVHHPDGTLTYYDLARSGAPHDLGNVGALGYISQRGADAFGFSGGMTISANGAVVVVRNSPLADDPPLTDAGGTLPAAELLAQRSSAPTSYFDLRGGVRRQLGRLRRHALSDDGAYLVAQSMEGSAILYVLNSGGEARVVEVQSSQDMVDQMMGR
jgi:hypothetical protein